VLVHYSLKLDCVLYKCVLYWELPHMVATYAVYFTYI